MEPLIYIVIIIAIIVLPDILAKSKKKKEYEYPDFDDMDSTKKVPGQIIIKKEDTLSNSEEVYFDLDDFFKTEYQQKAKLKMPEPKKDDVQTEHMDYADEVLEESSVVPQYAAIQNRLSGNDIVRGIIFAEIIMKPRAYRPFRGSNT